DLSVIAIFDTPFALHVQPALTVVTMPMAELGYQAVEMLLGKENPAGQEIVVQQPKPQLIDRASTRPL
ncbi:MAG: substrate-binding domain-containing protein, partial [Chloroflexota bacterium]